MINKIGNWIFGSFFRTIGRLLVFILLGVIIAHLVDFSDIISNFRITDLFFEKVNASTYQTADVDYYHSGTIWNTTSMPGNFQGYTYSHTQAYSTQYLDFDINNSNGVTIPNGTNQARFQIYLSLNGETDISYDSDNTGKPYFIIGNSQGYITFLLQTNGQWVNCSIQQAVNTNNVSGVYDLVCPIATSVSKLNKFNVSYNFIYQTGVNMPDFYVQNIRIGFSRKIVFELSDSTTIIENQNQNTQQQMQQQQQQHNEMMDSNTTQAEDDAGDFLGNFTVEDTGGLNAIITAPLATIQNLLNNTCNKLILPLPFVNDNIELPCLYPIYNDYFGIFFTLYQTIILGIISYRCIKSLFFDIKGFTNPEDDRIEVMDL